MSVITVNGEIDASKLGIIAMHEHIFLDLRKKLENFQSFDETLPSDKKVDISNIDKLRKNHRALKDNLLLSDIELAIQELLEFKKAGGNTIVDMTNIGMGRDPEALWNISKALGLNIIMGSGFYVESLHPDYINEKNEVWIAQKIINDIKTGVGNTNIRSGIIGEIGTSKEITKNEKKVLRAASIAQKETGAALSVHIDPWSTNGLEVLDLMSKNIVDLSCIIICHVDAKIDLGYCKALLNKGVTIEFDNFGKEYTGEQTGMGFMHDNERIKALKEIIDMGFISQLLISTDICLKTDLIKYSGHGYAHILNNILPLMFEEGITKKDIDIILIENPRKLLNIEDKL
ncbi:MAG: phosphotriesterase-related protein [Actinobacteria bacterium]|nr:phosphotriesterase-related protein [Actinomycetota bacterium]